MRYPTYKKTIALLLALFSTLKVVAATDDYSVTHYTNENGLPQNSVKGIELDKNGFLWIGTEAGLVRFDGQRFKVYDKDHYPILKSNRIYGLNLDASKTIYFHDGYRDYVFDQRGMIRMLEKESERSRTGHFMINPFWIRNDSDSIFYRVNGKVLWRIIIPKLGYVTQYRRWTQTKNKCYYRGRDGLLWSIDTNRNIRRVEIRGLSLPKGTSKENRPLFALYEHDKIAYLWLDKKIYRLDENSDGTLKPILVLETDVQDIHTYRNYPELNIQIIGTYTHGIYIYRRKQFKTYKHTNGFGNYYPQAPLGDSGVLTDRGPVYPSTSRFDYPFKYFITSRTLLLDSRSHYWINKGVYDKKSKYFIVMLDRQLKVLKAFPTKSLASCFRETPDGRIWMSSYQGQELGYVHKDSIYWLSRLWGNQSALTFLPVNNETFWVGGINLFAKVNVRTRQLFHYEKLGGFTIETLYLDKHNILWIGTTGNGFFALKQDKIYKLPLDKNAGLKNVHTFLKDENGFVWMSTNNGLFRCKKGDLDNFIAGKTKDIYYQCFKKESGFNTNEFNGSCTPSGIILGNGKFSLPSIDGLVQFYPDRVYESLPDGKIFIDRFLVDGKETDMTGHMSLQPSFQHIEIEVVSPFFGLPDNQQLEYNVKGLDKNWYPVNNDNKIVLNRFSYGSYTLQLRKRAGFGLNNFITTSLDFKVAPFFYQTWYFKLGLILIVSLLIFLFIKIRYAYLMKRNKELEQIITQRTAHLDNANRLKEKMLVMVGHDLQSPLNFLGHLSKINAEAVVLKQHDRVQQVSQHINSTTQKISTFVEEFSLWARVQDDAFNLRKSQFPISTLIADLQHFSKDILQFNGNILECIIDDDYLLYTNMELLKAMLRNLIDNANKHTRNGLINVSCANKNDTCTITITDNGKGISKDRLNRINELIHKAKQSTVIEPTNGRLGYQFIADFATRLQVDIKIFSEEDKGTTVCISGITISGLPKEQEKMLT